MKRFFELYQYLAPAICLPLAYFLWWRRLAYDHATTLLVLGLLVVPAYVIPAIGTNCARLWEIGAKWRIGRFRPHHGFVFGSLMSLAGLLCFGPEPVSFTVYAMIRMGFICSAMIGFWNWVYDIAAIRAGFLKVYNQNWKEGLGAEAIAGDYAPVYFGALGFCYGMCLPVIEEFLLVRRESQLYWPIFTVTLLAVVVLPSLLYMGLYYLRKGHCGIHSYQNERQLD